MRNWLRTVAWIGLTVAATYVIAEWSVLHKSGLHDLRAADAAVGGSAVGAGLFRPVPQEPERVALQAQVDELARTFAEFRAAKEREIADRDRLIAHLTKQIQALVAQRAPVEQVAALRAASRPVRWAAATQPDLAALAREAGFTRVEVRR